MNAMKTLIFLFCFTYGTENGLKVWFKNTFNIKQRVFFNSELPDVIVKYLIFLDVNIINLLKWK